MKNVLGVFSLVLAIGLTGCGGGGGQSGNNNINGTRAAVPVFITDSPETENDHVWATLFHVDVINASGQAQAVFDDPAGHAFDLKSLHDANGPRFAFLSNGSLVPGSHTSVRVTLGSSLTLFPRGSASGQAEPLDDTFQRDANGHAVVSFPLSTPRNLASGSDDIVIDFDLARFTVQNGKITPALHEGDRSGLHDSSRHERDDHRGTVANLSGTSPSFTFTLQSANSSVTVVTGASTVFFNSDNSANPTLANGKVVEVNGAFDAANNRLVAASVRIENGAQHADEAQIEGAPSAIDTAAAAFSISTQKVRGFMPAQTTVRVVTNSVTVFRSNGGVQLAAADFFTLLASAQSVEAEGAYDAASNTLTASRIKIEDEREGRDGEARGTPTTVQAAAGTFAIQPVTEFEGFVLTGNNVQVVTNANTRFRNDNSNVTSAAFFTALATAQTVRVEGTFNAGTITASSARIITNGNGGSNGGGNNGGGNGGGGDDGSGHR